MSQPTPSAAFDRVDQLKYRASIAKSLQTQEAQCREIAQAAMKDYGTLPPTRTFELYLVQGIAIPFGGSEKDARVIYAPEFIFVLDIGLEALVGIDILWNTVGLGDPRFPDFSKSVVRSVSSRNSSDIVFPNVAGSIMIGVKDGVSDDVARKGLEGAGLRNVQGSGWFWTAECQPFVERTVCKDVETKLAFVKFAEPNGVQRLIDFSPGWSCVRLV
jgi:hypothetical protein